jgi:outer membrane protein TolC
MSSSLSAQDAPPPTSPAPAIAPNVVRLSLDEIKQHVLGDNKLLQLAAHNVQSKDYAVGAARALYFPQIIGNVIYFHFNDNLGDVISGGGRSLHGPNGRTLFTFPAFAKEVAVINQDSAVANVAAVQPLTDLLKVRQGVRVAQADEQIAQAQMDKGARELVSGVEQLFWGIWAAQHIRAGLIAAAGPTMEAAKSGSLDARIAVVEGQQSLQQVEHQLGDLQEQLAILLELPTCTQFELVEPSLPIVPITCADDAVAMALASSPEVREAEATIDKARAAVKAAKLDYVPSVALVGGYLNQSFADYIQPNIGYVGVMGSYTFVDWGKRRNTIHERDEMVAMAILKLQSTQDTVRQNALKAFREYQESQQALKSAQDMVGLREEAVKTAANLPAKFQAGKDALTAQVDYLKADLAIRMAYVKLTALLGKQ